MTETSNPNPDKNQHITEYLEYYINQEEPADSAILLTGSWGCGKTYYIDRFIETYKNIIKKQSPKLSPYALQAIAPISYTPIIQEYLNQKEYKTAPMILKISLFGLKSITELDKSILLERLAFSNTNFTKADQFFLFLSKSSLQFTDAFFTKNIFKQIGLNFVNFMKSTTLSKQTQQIILIFDDLERTDIPLKELLGHINAFIERDHLKVILIANEDELTKEFIQQEQTEEKEISEAKAYISEDDLKNRETYQKFKEKVIGKTFKIQSDFDNTLAYFIQNNPYKEILLAHVFILKEIYSSQKNINLRQLKQTLGDLTYLLKHLEKKHQQHPQFIKEFIRAFGGLKLAIYTHELTKQMFERLLPSSEPQEESNPYELKSITNSQREAILKYTQETEAINNNFKNISKKYQIQTWLYPLDIWFDILFTNKSIYIKQATNQLIYFIPKPQQPLWMQCYRFPTLDDNTFHNLSQQLVENFLSLKKEPFYDLLHIIQLMISWSNSKLINIDIETIKLTTKKTLDKSTPYWINMYTKEWQDIRPERSITFDFNNKTGYGYYLNDNTSFQELHSLFHNKQTEIIEHIKKEQEEEQNVSILQALQENTYEKSIKLLFNPNLRWEPIFHKIEKEKLISILLQLNNNQLVNFNEILKTCYLNNDTLSGQVTCFYMTSEFLFWHHIKTGIETQFNTTQELFKPIQNYNFKQLLETIQNIIKTIQPFFITESLYKNNYADLEEYLCNSNQYTQQAIFDINIKEVFQNNLYKYETHQIDELYKILIKRYSNLPVINIFNTEFSFWKDILSYLKDNEWSSKHTIDKINGLIDIIEHSIKNKEN